MSPVVRFRLPFPRFRVKFGTRIESFIFLSPNSISDKDGFNGDAEENNDSIDIDDMFRNLEIAFLCLHDVMAWHMMLLNLVKNLPKLEKVSITDSGRRGRLSLSGEKLSEVKKLVHSASETEFNRMEFPDIVSNCYIPVFKLRVSGYVMKGIYFGAMVMKDSQGGNDALMNNEDGFEEAVYSEALMEILDKHKGMMHTVHLV